LVSTKDEVAQCFGDDRLLDTTGGHSPGVAVPFIMQRAAGVTGSLDDSRASARDVIVPAEDAQYFCNGHLCLTGCRNSAPAEEARSRGWAGLLAVGAPWFTHLPPPALRDVDCAEADFTSTKHLRNAFIHRKRKCAESYNK